MAAILSNNPFSVSPRTSTAENPCKHWRPAETVVRGASTWQGLKLLTEAPGSLSAAISAPNQSGPAGLSVGAEFSLLCLAILAGIVSTNGTNGLRHPRHVLTWLSDAFGAHGLINLSGAQFISHSGGQFISHSGAQFISHNGGQFLTHSAATVCITQGGHGSHHSARPRFASHSGTLASITQVGNMLASHNGSRFASHSGGNCQG